MLPVIAIIGRPNVGKSTLFNQLTKSRDALVYDLPGVTRDRQYGEGRLGDKPFIVIDTGGLGGESVGIDSKMAEQALVAIKEADIVFLVLDAKDGLTSQDEVIAREIRSLGKNIFVVVNKIDGHDENTVLSEFAALGFAFVTGISAAHGRGVTQLIQETLKEYPEPDTSSLQDDKSIRVAVVGRPNVGKSTLINRILGEERVVAFDAPGTTRNSIEVPFERDDQKYTLIDTAGVRRRSRVDNAIEKFSVIKTLQAIEASQVTVLLLDGQEVIADQDLRLIGFVLESGKSLVLAVNKWDGLTTDQRDKIKSEIDRRLGFVDFARIHFISALHGSGVGDLFASIKEAYRSAMQDMSTPRLTKLLQLAVANHQPPMVHGRRIKLRYAHTGGHNPPIIVIHGNQTQHVPESYTRYLSHYFRDALNLIGTPVRLHFVSGDNPYKGKKNVLTARQIQKRKRAKRRFK